MHCNFPNPNEALKCKSCFKYRQGHAVELSDLGIEEVDIEEYDSPGSSGDEDEDDNADGKSTTSPTPVPEPVPPPPKPAVPTPAPAPTIQIQTVAILDAPNPVAKPTSIEGFSADSRVVSDLSFDVGDISRSVTNDDGVDRWIKRHLDWDCKECLTHNVANNAECKNCCSDRPPPAEYWVCHCGEENTRATWNCEKCEARRPKLSKKKAVLNEAVNVSVQLPDSGSPC
jgi:hypothetical protein